MMRGRANIEYIVTDDRRVRDLMEHDCRTRLAETCGTRDESPSSNLGRGRQGDAIRTDIVSPQVDGTSPRLMSTPPQASQRRSTESDDAEREGSGTRHGAVTMECHGSIEHKPRDEERKP